MNEQIRKYRQEICLFGLGQCKNIIVKGKENKRKEQAVGMIKLQIVVCLSRRIICDELEKNIGKRLAVKTDCDTYQVGQVLYRRT